MGTTSTVTTCEESNAIKEIQVESTSISTATRLTDKLLLKTGMYNQPNAETEADFQLHEVSSTSNVDSSPLSHSPRVNVRAMIESLHTPKKLQIAKYKRRRRLFEAGDKSEADFQLQEVASTSNIVSPPLSPKARVNVKAMNENLRTPKKEHIRMMKNLRVLIPKCKIPQKLLQVGDEAKSDSDESCDEAKSTSSNYSLPASPTSPASSDYSPAQKRISSKSHRSAK